MLERYPDLSAKLQSFSKELISFLQLQDESQLYIPAFGRNTPPGTLTDTLTFDLEKMVREKLLEGEDTKKVILLLGEAGSGKSFFGQMLVRQQAEHYQVGKRIPLFISLPSLKNPTSELMQEALTLYGFSEEEMRQLKESRQSFFLVLDAYDEMNGFENLYRTNRLYEWDVKIMYTCRASHFRETQFYKSFFNPYQGEKELSSQLLELYCAPFSDEQIELYIKKYLERYFEELECAIRNKGELTEKWLQADTYLSAINQIPHLRQLVNSPFLMRITMEVLPIIWARYEALPDKEQRYLMTQEELVKTYVMQLFERAEKKLIVSQAHPGGPLFANYMEFAIKLAVKMQRKKKFQIEYEERSPLSDEPESEWAFFFSKNFVQSDRGDEKRRTLRELCFKACPLTPVGKNQYSFYHSTLRDYFVTQTWGPGYSLAITYKQVPDDEDIADDKIYLYVVEEQITCAAVNAYGRVERMAIKDSELPHVARIKAVLEERYHCVLMLSAKSKKPKKIEKNTVVMQRKNNHLIAYWNENDKVSERMIKEEDVKEIIDKLPDPEIEKSSSDKELINSITSKYGCTYSKNKKGLTKQDKKEIFKVTSAWGLREKKKAIPFYFADNFIGYKLVLCYREVPKAGQIKANELYLYLEDDDLKYAAMNAHGKIKRFRIKKGKLCNSQHIKKILKDPQKNKQLKKADEEALFEQTVKKGFHPLPQVIGNEGGKQYALITHLTKKQAKKLAVEEGIEVEHLQGKVIFGKGHFGRMRLARCLSNKRFVGVKKIKQEEKIQASKNEALLQTQLNGQPHLMPLWDFISIKKEVTKGYQLRLMGLQEPSDEQIKPKKLYLYLKEDQLIYAARNQQKVIERIVIEDAKWSRAQQIKDKLRKQGNPTTGDKKGLFKITATKGFTAEYQTTKEIYYQCMPIAGLGNAEVFSKHWRAWPEQVTGCETEKDPWTLKRQLLIHVAHSILKGLHFMHLHDIYHLDMKLDNVVIDKYGYVSVIDFGCAAKAVRLGHEAAQLWSLMGDLRYFSPERWMAYHVWKEKKEPLLFDPAKVDAWAVGMALLSLVLGKYPFVGNIHTWEPHDFEDALARIGILQNPPEGSLMATIKGLLQVIPEQRLNVKAALAQLLLPHATGIFANVIERHKVFAELYQEVPQQITAKPIVSSYPWEEDEEEKLFYVTVPGEGEKEAKNNFSLPAVQKPLLYGDLAEQGRIYFQEEEVLGDGDCGFTTVGASRAAVASALLGMENDLEAREQLGGEIYNALLSEQWTSDEEWQALHQQRIEAQEEQDSALREIRNHILELPEYERLPDTINWLREHGHEEEAQDLSRKDLDTYQKEQALERYCRKPEVFRAYANALLTQRLWLGYQSALLYAKHQGISLYIWTKSLTQPNGLELKKSYSTPTDQQVIHMLHTSGYTHFNLLVEAEQPQDEPVEATRDDTVAPEHNKGEEEEVIYLDDFNIVHKGRLDSTADISSSIKPSPTNASSVQALMQVGTFAVTKPKPQEEQLISYIDDLPSSLGSSNTKKEF